MYRPDDKNYAKLRLLTQKETCLKELLLKHSTLTCHYLRIFFNFLIKWNPLLYDHIMLTQTIIFDFSKLFMSNQEDDRRIKQSLADRILFPRGKLLCSFIPATRVSLLDNFNITLHVNANMIRPMTCSHARQSLFQSFASDSDINLVCFKYP